MTFLRFCQVHNGISRNLNLHKNDENTLCFPTKNQNFSQPFPHRPTGGKSGRKWRGRGVEMLRRMTQLFRGVFFCPAFSVAHLLSLHLVSSLPRPHAAVRFLSLRGERNQRRAGGPESPLPLRSAPCLCATGTRRPLDPRAVLPGKSRAARTIYLRGRYPGNMSFDA